MVVTISFVLSGGRSSRKTGPGTFGCVVVLAKLMYVLVTPRGLSATVLLFKMMMLVVFVKHITFGGLTVLLNNLTLINYLKTMFLLTVPGSASVPFLRQFSA